MGIKEAETLYPIDYARKVATHLSEIENEDGWRYEAIKVSDHFGHIAVYDEDNEFIGYL